MLNLRKQAIVLPSVPWNLLVKRYQETNHKLSSSLKSLASDTKLNALHLPSLSIDAKHPETLALLRKYLDQQGEVTKIYYDPHFLEIVLRKLQE